MVPPLDHLFSSSPASSSSGQLPHTNTSSTAGFPGGDPVLTQPTAPSPQGSASLTPTPYAPRCWLKAEELRTSLGFPPLREMEKLIPCASCVLERFFIPFAMRGKGRTIDIYY